MRDPEARLQRMAQQNSQLRESTVVNALPPQGAQGAYQRASVGSRLSVH